MRIFILLILSFASALNATEKLRVYEDHDPQTPLYETSNYSQITAHLNGIGVQFEKWVATQSLPPSAQESDVYAAYAQDIDKLMLENNYQTVDIIRMFPDNPKKEQLRKKFLNEHTHTEDEVRFFVEGSALFYLHTQGKVFIVHCEEGDLISIPANYAHWFDMGEEPHFTAIRFFTDPAGWVANFTESPIADRFPRFE